MFKWYIYSCNLIGCCGGNGRELESKLRGSERESGEGVGGAGRERGKRRRRAKEGERVG